MYTLHPFKYAEISKKKTDDLRKRTILEYDLKIDFMKFQSVFSNLSIENPLDNASNRKHEKLLNDQIVEKIRQQQLLYQNEQLKIQQNNLITKILKSGSSKFHYLKNEFPKYSLYIVMDEYQESLINEYYRKVKENKREIDKAQEKLTELLKLVNISKIQEEKQCKDEQIKSKYYKEHRNKSKSDQILLSNKTTIETIKYLDQLISNFQNQLVQIKKSKFFTKKICYLYINEAVLSIKEIIIKINKYFQNADSIAIVEKLKSKFKLLSEKWETANKELKDVDGKISKETDQIELQKLDRQKNILNNSIKYIKYEIAYFYVKLIIFCNDDSKENLNKLLVEYKDLNKELNNLLKNSKNKNIRKNLRKEICSQMERTNDIILDLETRIEADYYDKNKTLYKDILVSSKILFKDERNRNDSKNLISIIYNRIKEKVNKKTNNGKNGEDVLVKYTIVTYAIHEQINYNEENLILYQFIKTDQYDDVIKILTKKKSLKASESKQNRIVADKCDLEIKNINRMLDKLNGINDEDDSMKKQEDDDSMKKPIDIPPKQTIDIPIHPRPPRQNFAHGKQRKNDNKNKNENSTSNMEIENNNESLSEGMKSLNSEIKPEHNDEAFSEGMESLSSEIKPDHNDESYSEGFESTTYSYESELDSEIPDLEDIEGNPQINFEDYDIRRFLSKGGSGSIMIAVDKATNLNVAIKSYSYHVSKEQIIRVVKISNTDIIGLAKTIGYHFALTKSEITKYKNKIENFDAYLNGCIVMNLYKNTNISDQIKEYLDSNGLKKDVINPTIRTKIIFGVAAIMKKLHQNQIVHRDLKISNILLDDNNEPVICDFDLSYSINDENYEKNLNQAEEIQGTPYYVSPERIRLDEDKTNAFASDVYSYAILLYFMFSSSIKFIDDDSFGLHQFYKFISEGRRPVKPKNIPEHYWELIQMCWNDNPSSRPTFEEITNILKKDKYALDEFGMKTDLNVLHNYQEKLGEYERPVETMSFGARILRI